MNIPSDLQRQLNDDRTRSEAERHRLLSELQQARADRDHSLERLPPVAQPSAAVSSGASSLEASFRDLCRPGWVIDRREVDVSNEIIGRGACRHIGAIVSLFLNFDDRHDRWCDTEREMERLSSRYQVHPSRSPVGIQPLCVRT